MCGIAGLIDTDGGAIERAFVVAMTEPLKPRGPDELHTWLGDGAALGHTRLRVIDLSPAAAQPFHDADADAHLVFNGEIYNFLELRAELTGLGHTFRSRSDTEVLLKAYVEWGEAMLPKIDGMFSFAVWDAKRRRLLAARDRMGKKPFYYAWLPRDGRAPLFAFASELKSLLALPGFPRKLSVEALSQYLVFEHVPPPLSIIEGAHKLGPSECLVLDCARGGRAEPRTHRYWRLPFVERPTPIGDDEAADTLWSLLRRAVERRLVSDVPLGIFLSGGLDSSAVTAAAASLLGGGRALRTFAIGFSDPSYDESAHARTVADFLGCQHSVQVLEPQDLLSVLPDVGRFLDEPLGDASIIPTYVLSRFAREHVAVALGGDGGDELFSGYPTFIADRYGGPVLDLMPGRLHEFVRGLAGRLPARSEYFSFDFKVNQFLRGGRTPGPQRHQRWLASFLPEELPGLFSPVLAGASRLNPLAMLDSRLAGSLARSQGDRLMEFYSWFYLGSDVNVKVDRASGAVGLEVRAPLLDTELVSFACRLPARQRTRGRLTKVVLRNALKQRLPAGILERKKKGFGVPVAAWLKRDLLPLVRDMMSPERLRRQRLFEPRAVENLIDDHVLGRRDRRKQLWTLLTLQRWLVEYGATL